MIILIFIVCIMHGYLCEMWLRNRHTICTANKFVELLDFPLVSSSLSIQLNKMGFYSLRSCGLLASKHCVQAEYPNPLALQVTSILFLQWLQCHTAFTYSLVLYYVCRFFRLETCTSPPTHTPMENIIASVTA